MKHFLLHAMFSALLFHTVPAWSNCDDACMKALEEEIRILDADVDKRAKELLRPGKDAAIWLHQSVVEQVLRSINSTNRKFAFHSTTVSGNFASDDWDCGWFGHGGWVIGPDGGGAADADLALGQFQSEWQPGWGMKFAVSAVLTAKLSLHYHQDPCIGGGVGWPGFTAGATADTVRGVIDLSTKDDGTFIFRVKGEQPPYLGIVVIVVGLPIPTVVLPVKSGLRKTLTSVNLSTLWKKEGVLKLPQADGTVLEKKYQLKLKATAATVKQIGYDAELELEVTYP